MSFHTFIYNTDYMDLRFISLENCSLLHTKIAMSHPLVFFTRAPTYDCKCDILVIELDTKEEIRVFKRTQTMAKTVIVALDVLEALDAYLESGREGSTFFFYGNFIARIDGENPGKHPNEASPSFSYSVNAQPITNLENSGSSLDSKVLRKTTWITEHIAGCSRVGACKSEASVCDMYPFHEWPVSSNFPDISSEIYKKDSVPKNDVNNKLRNNESCKKREMVDGHDAASRMPLAGDLLDDPFASYSFSNNPSSRSKSSSRVGLKLGFDEPASHLAENKAEGDTIIHLLDTEKQVTKALDEDGHLFDLSSEPIDPKPCHCTKKFAISSSEPTGLPRRCLSVDPYIIDSMHSAFKNFSWNSVHKGYDDLSLLENVISFPSGHHFFKVRGDKHMVGRTKNVFRHSKGDKSRSFVRKFTGRH